MANYPKREVEIEVEVEDEIADIFPLIEEDDTEFDDLEESLVPVQTVIEIIPAGGDGSELAPSNFPMPEDLEPLRPNDDDFPRPKLGPRLPAADIAQDFPLNIISLKRQAAGLGWTPGVMEVVNQQTGIFFRLPMVCQANDCRFATICNVNNKELHKGRPCPLQIVQLFRTFRGYVQSLDIKPNEFQDLKAVADLCRMDLVMWNTDMEMKLQPEIVEEVKVVNQRDGTPYKHTVINKNRELQEKTRTQIQGQLDDLVATRRARAGVTKAANDSLASIMAQINEAERLKRKKVGRPKSITGPS